MKKANTVYNPKQKETPIKEEDEEDCEDSSEDGRSDRISQRDSSISKDNY